MRSIIVFSFIQRFQRLFWLNGDFAFVEHRTVKAEDVDEEVIDGLALVLLEVVAFVGQVDIAHLVLCSIEAVDALQVGELEGGNAGGPVATIADDEHRFGSHDSCEFWLTSASCTELNGFAALAGTTTIEVRSQMNHEAR